MTDIFIECGRVLLGDEFAGPCRLTVARSMRSEPVMGAFSPSSPPAGWFT